MVWRTSPGITFGAFGPTSMRPTVPTCRPGSRVTISHGALDDQTPYERLVTKTRAGSSPASQELTVTHATGMDLRIWLANRSANLFGRPTFALRATVGNLRLIHARRLEAPPGFEPGMEVLQTSALPLGDGADREGRSQVRQPRATKKPARRRACAGCAGVRIGAGNGIRTRDFDLGKVALYH